MDKSGNASYKYSCRKCPVRDRCIEQGDNSPSVKNVIINAFANRTDTLRTWEFLQGHCLLMKAEQLREQQASKGSLLSLRLRRTREAKQTEVSQAVSAPSSDPPTIDGVKEAQAPPRIAPRLKPKLEMPSRFGAAPELPAKIKTPARLSSYHEPVKNPDNQRYWLTMHRGGRHIMLPVDGPLVLGRYDPSFGIPPDVDLAYEDGPQATISRRHAQIIGQQGLYTIQEMGGKLGVIVNGERIPLGVAYQLKIGDKIVLGHCEMLYDVVPQWIVNLNTAQDREHWLMLCGTGQRISIPIGSDLIIGKNDRYMKFTPDIDLAILKNKADKVSRRHARLFFETGSATLYIEDMGSGFGTKINGELIMLGEARALVPGDHIWLGGSVLAYDVSL